MWNQHKQYKQLLFQHAQKSALQSAVIYEQAYKYHSVYLLNISH